MKPLQILATNDSPAINFNPKREKFMIVGNSMPENAVGFYKQVIDWLKLYAESPNEATEFIFQMNLLNTSSSKLFSDIFKMINIISEKSEVKVLWYYNYGDDVATDASTADTNADHQNDAYNADVEAYWKGEGKSGDRL